MLAAPCSSVGLNHFEPETVLEYGMCLHDSVPGWSTRIDMCEVWGGGTFLIRVLANEARAKGAGVPAEANLVVGPPPRQGPVGAVCVLMPTRCFSPSGIRLKTLTRGSPEVVHTRGDPALLIRGRPISRGSPPALCSRLHVEGPPSHTASIGGGAGPMERPSTSE